MTDATRPFLRRLPRDGFVPAGRDVEGVGVGTLPAAADAQARAFAAAVAAFAAGFWALAPAARRAAWEALAARAFGPAAAWLAELKPALAVVPVPQAEARAAAVADAVRDLVARPPADRAARRLAWLRAPERGDPAWAAAARAVLRSDPPLARLDPRLFDWFSLDARPAPVAADHRAPPAKADRVPAAPPPAPVAPQRSGCGWSLGLFAVVAVVRLIFSGAGTHRAPVNPPPPPPGFEWPGRQPGLPPDPQWPAPAVPTSRVPQAARFTTDEVRAFREFERRLASGGAASPTPVGYPFWVLMGRPDAVLPSLPAPGTRPTRR